ncbi:hypothetical protein JAAARDRAFT_60073 [Jaapia argillacea MUCL 33604]|uniref:Uncharacterized protein n=1 Tax=Jaapia argillacea MUCL 33604 TaxID=933084 RepID=A0A067PJL5_9AGAM|nr:hypothetical protein JAAARDRAFT_60073 [Jaapia argillacea MUCL 33604]
MVALMWAAHDAIKYAETHPKVKHLHFFADNSATVQAVFEPKLRGGQSFAIPFRETITGFLDSDGTHTVKIAWTPGHQDIPGNKCADALAKDAVTNGGESGNSTSSWKPPECFEWLLREVYGRVTQCRVGHAFIGEYYAQFHIPETVDCPCDELYQTREHILRERIDALASFIGESGAFTKTGEPRTKKFELPQFDDEPDPNISDDDESDGEG